MENAFTKFDAGELGGSVSFSRQPSIRVPGAAAGTYVGRQLFHCVLRHILSSKSGLGRFARSLFSLSRKPFEGSTETFSAGLPMPLPFPEACRPGSLDGSHDGALKCGVNAVVLVLNHLHLGQPSVAPPSLRLGNRLSKRQWKSVALLKSFLKSWVDEDDIDPVSMGRSASKVESIEEAIAELEARAKTFVSGSSNGYFPHRSETFAAGLDEDAGTVVGQSSFSSFSTFKEIDPDRLSFVGTPSFEFKTLFGSWWQSCVREAVGSQPES